jgi:hypothetical protein
MKKIIIGLLFLVTSLTSYSQTSLAPPTGYNKVETSYTQTTISQDVVFNSTMQAGGTLTFTVNTTSGGGRTGSSEPVSLSLVFYNASGGVVNTVNSSTIQLPTPSAGWVTETVSATNCGGSCANVAYVQVQMHGIDGSYWAGDYGPQYYGPSLTFNGGSNILYNPQFGPYNGTQVQGWATTASWGVCQGAYGGSNDCVTNYSGVTANAGNYIATAGTPSAPAGGTPAAPPTPTFTQIKFGPAQVADAQWNVQACTQTNTCQIYSTNPGVTYNSTSPTYISSGQYISFIANTGSDSATNPWTMILYNSDGSVAQNLGSGHILVQGTDSSGKSYFFFSNDYYNGTLFSGNLGLSGEGATFTGTANPSVSDTNTFAGNMSTSPLAAGQTGGTTTSSAPTVTSTSTTDNVTTSSSVGPTTTTTNQYLFDNQTYNVIGTSTPTTVTTTTTPVTTTNYSDGTSTTTNGTPSSTSTTTYNYTVTGPAHQPTSPYTGTNTNGVYITQSSGSSNTVSAYQSGHGNYTELNISGTNNSINAGQGYTFNSIGIASESLTASNYNVLGISVAGSSNNITASQLGTANSAIINVAGGTNTVTVNQNGNNNQEYNIINGSGNALSVSQTGNNHIAAVNLYGNSNVATVTQNGSAAMGAVLSLTNSGGPNNVNVIQTGSTSQNFSLQQTCTSGAGCNATVTQGH